MNREERDKLREAVRLNVFKDAGKPYDFWGAYVLGAMSALLDMVDELERKVASKEWSGYLAIEARLGSARAALVKARERFSAMASFEPHLGYVVTDTANQGVADLDAVLASLEDIP